MRELATDQRQLRLHQPLALVDVLGDQFQALRQCLFLVAVDGQRLFAAQAGGDFVEASGQRFGLFQQVRLGGLWQLFATVRAQSGEVAEQGVRKHQEAETEVGVLTEVSGLHQHVAEGGGTAPHRRCAHCAGPGDSRGRHACRAHIGR
jgi:hypothetical protein